MPTAIPDSSVIISLAGIDRLRLIGELNDLVVVPPAVVREVIEEGKGQTGSEELRRAIEDGWIKVVDGPKNKALVAALKANLGDGESEVIALGTEIEDAIVLLDDKSARTSAGELELKKTGIVGILLRAKRLGKIESISTELEKLRRDVGFRLSETIVAKILAQSGE
jgi:predicted nucleic acid-binding protein